MVDSRWRLLRAMISFTHHVTHEADLKGNTFRHTIHPQIVIASVTEGDKTNQKLPSLNMKTFAAHIYSVLSGPIIGDGDRKRRVPDYSSWFYLALIFHALGILLNFTAGTGIWPKIKLGNGIWAKFQDPLLGIREKVLDIRGENNSVLLKQMRARGLASTSGSRKVLDIWGSSKWDPHILGVVYGDFCTKLS